MIKAVLSRLVKGQLPAQRAATDLPGRQPAFVVSEEARADPRKIFMKRVDAESLLEVEGDIPEGI